MKRTLVGWAAALIWIGSGTAWAAQTGYQSDPSLSAAQDISGIWQLEAYSPRLAPIGGGEAPLTPEGRVLFKKNTLHLKDADLAKRKCLPLGPPRNFTSPYPFMILQIPGRVLMTHEQNRGIELVRMTDQHYDPAKWDPSYRGDSIGRWDGAQLIVDVTNFNGENWLDDAGLPSSDELHLVERWRKIDDNARLEVRLTIEDPKIFTHSWSARLTFRPRPGLRMQDDWVCDEPHRDVTDVKGAPAYFKTAPGHSPK